MITKATSKLYLFFSKHRNSLQQLAMLLLALLAVNSVLTDLHLCVAMPYDLRNRIVGIRMLKDGLSPYFYQWHRGDTVRYYNPNGFIVAGNIYTSEATATPFFHLLLRPFAELNQLQFNIAWLLLQYMALAGTALAFCRRYGSRFYLLIAAVSILFSYSVGWRHQVFQGQMYIFLPLFAAWAYYYATLPVKTLLSVSSAALFSCMAILTRPVFIVFFVPFVFQYKWYKSYVVATAALLALWALYAYLHPVQHLNWAAYFRLVKLHSQMHVDGATSVKGSFRLLQFEGVDTQTDSYSKAAGEVAKGVEETAAYIILQRMGIKTSVLWLLTAAGVSVLLIILPLYSGRWRKTPLPHNQLFTLAFCTFFLFDFFSPVARSTYYFCLWLFPLLLFFTQNRKPLLFLLATTGFILNLVILPGVKMEHTIGQGLLLVAFLLFAYQKPQRLQKLSFFQLAFGDKSAHS